MISKSLHVYSKTLIGNDQTSIMSLTKTINSFQNFSSSSNCHQWNKSISSKPFMDLIFPILDKWDWGYDKDFFEKRSFMAKRIYIINLL